MRRRFQCSHVRDGIRCCGSCFAVEDSNSSAVDAIRTLVESESDRRSSQAAFDAVMSDTQASPHVKVPLIVTTCDVCGHPPSDLARTDWEKSEIEVSSLLEGLPATLYSAWALNETFATEHPAHHLAGRWKRYLADVCDADADSANSAEEAEGLRHEASEHRAAAERCRISFEDARKRLWQPKNV